MYCVMRASVPSLYNVYRRYDMRHCTPSTGFGATQLRHGIAHGMASQLARGMAQLLHVLASHGIYAALHI